MSTHSSLSPLLRARPDFLGVALGGDISVINELFRISYLSTIANYYLEGFNNEIHLNDIESEAEIPYDCIASCSTEANDELETQHTSEEHKVAAAEISTTDPTPTDHVKLVADRSETGTEMIPYAHKAVTLKLFDVLMKLKIPFETEIYKPKELRSFVDGNIFYCKNLFLKDRKGQFFLVICHEDLNIDLKQLRKTLNAYRNFNFGTDEDMASLLNTLPGGVTPFGLMTPNAADVKMVIHKSLVNEDAWLMFHPFDNDLATRITLPSLMRFLKSFNHSVMFVK